MQKRPGQLGLTSILLQNVKKIEWETIWRHKIIFKKPLTKPKRGKPHSSEKSRGEDMRRCSLVHFEAL